MRRPVDLGLAIVITLVAAQPLALADSCLVDPVAINPNLVTSTFGKSRDLPQYNGVPHVHWGVDFQARDPANPSQGAKLLAGSDGTVIGAGFWGSGYGNRVAIKRDNGDILIYSHMAKIEPRLKSGAAIGFKDTNGGQNIGTEHVSAGSQIGIAGGTANHMETNERAIHLHLEYVTNYGGVKLRETNDGTNSTRSHYMRNALDFMCKAPPLAPGAGSSSGAGAPGESQADTAARAQPTVTDRERYGIPDAPPYDTYAGMSESQIIEAEMLRRTLDTEWEERLTDLSKRGLWIEMSRIDGAMLWLDQRISEKKSRVEAMVAMLLAQKTHAFFTPRMSSAKAQMERMTAVRQVE